MIFIFFWMVVTVVVAFFIVNFLSPHK